jgi:hypothetical protein
MAETKSIYPVKDSEEALLQEAKSQLPITTENELVVLLETHKNTINKDQANGKRESLT